MINLLKLGVVFMNITNKLTKFFFFKAVLLMSLFANANGDKESYYTGEKGNKFLFLAKVPGETAKKITQEINDSVFRGLLKEINKQNRKKIRKGQAWHINPRLVRLKKMNFMYLRLLLIDRVHYDYSERVKPTLKMSLEKYKKKYPKVSSIELKFQGKLGIEKIGKYFYIVKYLKNNEGTERLKNLLSVIKEVNKDFLDLYLEKCFSGKNPYIIMAKVSVNMGRTYEELKKAYKTIEALKKNVGHIKGKLKTLSKNYHERAYNSFRSSLHLYEFCRTYKCRVSGELKNSIGYFDSKIKRRKLASYFSDLDGNNITFVVGTDVPFKNRKVKAIVGRTGKLVSLRNMLKNNMSFRNKCVERKHGKQANIIPAKGFSVKDYENMICKFLLVTCKVRNNSKKNNTQKIDEHIKQEIKSVLKMIIKKALRSAIVLYKKAEIYQNNRRKYFGFRMKDGGFFIKNNDKSLSFNQQVAIAGGFPCYRYLKNTVRDRIKDLIELKFGTLMSKKVKNSKIIWGVEIEPLVIPVKATVVRSNVSSTKEFIDVTQKSRNVKKDLYSVMSSDYRSFRANNINLYDYSYDMRCPKKIVSYKI